MFGADPEFRKEWEPLEKVIKARHSEFLVQLNFSGSDAEQYGKEPERWLLQLMRPTSLRHSYFWGIQRVREKRKIYRE